MKKTLLIPNIVAIIISFCSLAFYITYEIIYVFTSRHISTASCITIVIRILSFFLIVGLFVVAAVMNNERDSANASLLLHIGVFLQIFAICIFSRYYYYYDYYGWVTVNWETVADAVLLVLSFITCITFMCLYVSRLNVKKSAASLTQTAGAKDAYEELIKLKKLLDGGIISQELYDIKKAKYLGKL